MATLLAGCSAMGGISSEEQPPSPPPPVALAQGTLVQQTWQFANPCSFVASIAIARDGEPTLQGALADPGHVSYFSIRCAIGDELCYVASGDTDRHMLSAACVPCSPGVLPAQRLTCD